MATGQAAMATLLPKGGKLEAQLLVPSRAAGFVDEGQTVRLLYDAFPYQKFGFHTGVVSDVSRTVISSTDLPIAPPTQEPVFLITVDLGRQDVDANNQLYALQSGMTLSADIVLEDRKIWEWVFEPLLGAAEK
jgi:membrane fusion protein